MHQDPTVTDGGGSISANITHHTLEAFLDAFNRHDLDAIMDYFAEECVFYMPRGSTPRGDTYHGKVQVRAGLARRFGGVPETGIPGV